MHEPKHILLFAKKEKTHPAARNHGERCLYPKSKRSQQKYSWSKIERSDRTGKQNLDFWI